MIKLCLLGIISFGIASLGCTKKCNTEIGETKAGKWPSEKCETTIKINPEENLPPSLSIDNVSITEGNSGTKTLTFTVTQSASTTSDTTFYWATSDGTASTGSDYVGVSSTQATIAAGATTATLNVTINGDTTIESGESFTVTINNPTNAAISTATGTGTITNDDSALAWYMVDGNGTNGINKNTANPGADSRLIEFNSKLYAGWGEQNGSSVSQQRVAVYNNNDDSPSWSFVDGNGANGINKNTSVSASWQSFAVLNSKLYIGWTEPNGGVNQVRVAVYNGNDSAPSWAFVDGNGATGINKDPTRNASGDVMNFLTVFNSKLYAIWYEWNGSAYQLRVAVYNGNDGAPSWAFVDGNGATGINKDTAQWSSVGELVVLNSKLYAVWYERSSGIYQIRVAVYNGNDGAPSWTFVDGNGVNGINKDASRSAYQPHVAVLNSKLYVGWSEMVVGDSVQQVRVAVYNGNDGSPSWAFVDGNGATGINKNTSKSVNNHHLMVSNSVLYASWSEANVSNINQIRVVAYNGNDASPSWTFIDGGGSNGINKDPAQQAGAPNLLSFNSKLYASWYEYSSTHQIRMSVYR